ncbi:MAG: FAD:protein FMN transferase, partial [Rhizomicrobium sp.]
MRETRIIMGMPVTLSVADAHAAQHDLDVVFDEFTAVDNQFSVYKQNSEISRINRGEIAAEAYSSRMREVIELCEKTRSETGGYFDIARPDGTLDPSGVVKGWAILGAARMLATRGFENYFVEAGGDIQACGKSEEGVDWRVGIRNPFEPDQIVKILIPREKGVATSGNYVRGNHIYNPHSGQYVSDDIVSLTVIGPDILEADRYATAAFAMGREGIFFIERSAGLEGYEINATGIARMTTGLARYFP